MKPHKKGKHGHYRTQFGEVRWNTLKHVETKYVRMIWGVWLKTCPPEKLWQWRIQSSSLLKRIYCNLTSEQHKFRCFSTRGEIGRSQANMSRSKWQLKIHHLFSENSNLLGCRLHKDTNNIYSKKTTAYSIHVKKNACMCIPQFYFLVNFTAPWTSPARLLVVCWDCREYYNDLDKVQQHSSISDGKCPDLNCFSREMCGFEFRRPNSMTASTFHHEARTVPKGLTGGSRARMRPTALTLIEEPSDSPAHQGQAGQVWPPKPALQTLLQTPLLLEVGQSNTLRPWCKTHGNAIAEHCTHQVLLEGPEIKGMPHTLLKFPHLFDAWGPIFGFHHLWFPA